MSFCTRAAESCCSARSPDALAYDMSLIMACICGWMLPRRMAFAWPRRISGRTRMRTPTVTSAMLAHQGRPVDSTTQSVTICAALTLGHHERAMSEKLTMPSAACAATASPAADTPSFTPWPCAAATSGRADEDVAAPSSAAVVAAAAAESEGAEEEGHRDKPRACRAPAAAKDPPYIGRIESDGRATDPRSTPCCRARVVPAAAEEIERACRCGWKEDACPQRARLL